MVCVWVCVSVRVCVRVSVRVCVCVRACVCVCEKDSATHTVHYVKIFHTSDRLHVQSCVSLFTYQFLSLCVPLTI